MERGRGQCPHATPFGCFRCCLISEILKLNKGMLKTCRKVGIRMEDVQYIELYNDYNRLLDEGEKVSYIVAVLAERYNVCERKVYTLIKRLQSDCNPFAV